jgi:hypothetical protein
LAAKLRQISGQADIREPCRNAGAESSDRPPRLLDRVSQNVADFVFHAPSMTLGASFQPHLHFLFQVTNYKLRHRRFPAYHTIDITISIVGWLFKTVNGALTAGDLLEAMKAFEGRGAEPRRRRCSVLLYQLPDRLRG